MGYLYKVIWELSDGNTQGETEETSDWNVALNDLALKLQELQGDFNWVQIERVQ